MKSIPQTENNFASYPSWICPECAKQMNKWPSGLLETFYTECGWCKKTTNVSSPRNYGYPHFDWEILKRNTDGCENKKD